MYRASAPPRWLAGLALAAVGCLADPPLDVAPSVDLTRFQGKWYEIASLPRVTQTDCYGTTAFYSPSSDGSYQFVNQCNVASTDGPLKTVTMTATVPDPASPAKLALDVGGFTGAYWILETGPNYEYAVVGHPSRAYLWILSRTPVLEAATLQGVLNRAQGNRFDTSKLQYTPQPPGGERLDSEQPVGPVPAAPAKTGCSMSTAAGDPCSWSVGVAAAALVAALRRGRRGRVQPVPS
jgi:apolipoprotein D and lipocalin family protein